MRRPQVEGLAGLIRTVTFVEEGFVSDFLLTGG